METARTGSVNKSGMKAYFHLTYTLLFIIQTTINEIGRLYPRIQIDDSFSCKAEWGGGVGVCVCVRGEGGGGRERIPFPTAVFLPRGASYLLQVMCSSTFSLLTGANVGTWTSLFVMSKVLIALFSNNINWLVGSSSPGLPVKDKSVVCGVVVQGVLQPGYWGKIAWALSSLVWDSSEAVSLRFDTKILVTMWGCVAP